MLGTGEGLILTDGPAEFGACIQVLVEVQADNKQVETNNKTTTILIADPSKLLCQYMDVTKPDNVSLNDVSERMEKI